MGYKKNYNSLLPDDFVLSEEFETIVEQLENTKDHFYITGKAGSGKSTLLAYFRSVTQKNTAVLAPTGVAAIRVKGQTIHSFFGFPPKVIQTRHIKKVRQVELLQNLETLIIDEISMVRADVFDAIDYSLRVHRKKLTQPFGGVQVIVFGDLFQLPPVVNMDESSLLERMYPNGQFFFHSNIFQPSGSEQGDGRGLGLSHPFTRIKITCKDSTQLTLQHIAHLGIERRHRAWDRMIQGLLQLW